MSICIIVLYSWALFTGKHYVSQPFVVDTISAIIAGVIAAICLITYIWPPERIAFWVSLIIYFLTASMSASLVVQTGNLNSPFIALWMLICFFAGIFRFWGVLPILLCILAFGSMRYFYHDDLSLEQILIFCASGPLPLIVSAFIWRKDNKKYDENAVNARKNIKDELVEITSKSEIIVNAIGDGVMAVDGTGTIKLINPAAQDIVGWSDKDSISLNYKSVIKLLNQNDKAPDAASDPIGQVLNLNQQVRTNDLGLETKNGKKILISLVVSPIGEPGSGAIAVFRDITKEKTEEREQAEFISTASHEMRTPVASIEGYIGLAMNPRTAQIDIRAREYLNKAHQSAEHLGHLFQDLLDISKADDGRITNNPKVVNIVAFVYDIVQDFKQRAADKGLRLIYKPMPEDDFQKHIVPSFSVNLDNDHVHEIIDNLIENAIKYSQSGSVVVDVAGAEDHVVISVKDSGIGIAAEDMPHLFQKFYRIENKDTREIGGTGLGLYLCRKLAELMGGKIWAESTVGVGSTFYVQLPRVSDQQASILAEQATMINQQTAQQQATVQQPIQPPVVIAEPVNTPPAQSAQKQVMDIIKPANSVPRGQALTPEQIASYVAAQHALAQQMPKPALQNLPRNGRTQSFVIPQRGPKTD